MSASSVAVVLAFTTFDVPETFTVKSDTLPLSASIAPLKKVIRPSPPESTTPACFNTGSISGVFKSVSSIFATIASQNSIISSVSEFISISSAFSAPAFATVRIVPSLGFITALYAVSAACCTAFPIIVTSSVSFPFISFTNPLNICDIITPEFPLAPLNEPLDIAFPSSSILGFSRLVTSFAADMIVIVIFVPVSPSGTGNTLSSLIYSFFASNAFAPDKNIFCIITASIDFKATFLFLLVPA